MITREEAIKALKEIKDRAWGWHINEQVLGIDYDEFIEIMDAVLLFLNSVSREQVEKVWRGEWIAKHYVDGILEGTNFDECSKCGYQRVFENPKLKTKYMFCPNCGAPMTDKAVDMVMKRLEVLRDE